MIFFAIINVLFYVIASVLYWRKQKRFDAYFFILLVWTLTSILCAYNYKNGELIRYNLYLYPFIYLFILFMLSIQPYKGFGFTRENVIIQETSLVKTLMWIYIISSAISMVYTIPNTLYLFSQDSWGELRNELYEDADSIQLYGSQFERLMKNISSYLTPFGCVMAFYQLSKPKIDKLKTLILFTLWIGNIFLASTLVASRGMVANLMMQVILMYFIFKDIIPSGRKRVFAVLGAIAAFYLVSYTLIVSVSRFGTESNSSILLYLGHSMIAFDGGLMSQMHSFSWGKHFFEFFIQLFGGNAEVDYAALGGTWGTAFITYIGSLYCDFGPVVTFLIIVVINRILNKIISKGKFQLSDMVVIVYFASYFLKGVFVIGRSLSLTWLTLYIVYRMIRFAEK